MKLALKIMQLITKIVAIMIFLGVGWGGGGLFALVVYVSLIIIPRDMTAAFVAGILGVALLFVGSIGAIVIARAKLG